MDDYTLVNSSFSSTIQAPIEQVDLPAWCFGLSEAEYRSCSPAHVSAAVTAVPDGRRMSINVEVIGGSPMVQYYVEEIGEVSEFFHVGENGVSSGLDPERRTYSSPASFDDPDGNIWILQEITARLPGLVDPGASSFGSVSDLASAIRRAAAAHGEHEKRIEQKDTNWPDWYAAYIVAEAGGAKLPK